MRIRWAYCVLISLVILVIEHRGNVIDDDDIELPDVESVSRKVEKLLHEVDDAIGSLKTIKAWAIQHHRRVNTVKTVSTTISVISTVVGIVLAFFTGGSSLLLTASTFVASMTSGVISVTAGDIDATKTKEYNQNAANIIKKVHDSFEDLKAEIDVATALADSIKKKLEDSVGISAAERILISVINEGFTIPINTYESNEAIKYFKTFELANRLKKGKFPTRTAALPTDEALYAQANQDIKKLLASKAVELRKEIKWSIRGKVVGGAPKGVSAVIGIVTNVLEVIDLVNSWKSDHPSVKVVDSVIDDMNSLRKDLVKMKSNLKQECPK